MKQAIFLDRDGTLIKDRGFLSDTSQVVFYSSTIEALKLLQKRFKLFIVTNQCGVANGITSIEDVDRVNKYIIDHLAENDIDIKECYVCPHAIDSDCKCRKPRSFFAEKAALNYGLDLDKSYMIGDHLSDMEFANAFGGRGVYVLTGHGRHEQHLVPDDVIVSRNILSASMNIIEKETINSVNNKRVDNG